MSKKETHGALRPSVNLPRQSCQIEIFTLPPSAGRRTQTASVPMAEMTPAKRAFLPST